MRIIERKRLNKNKVRAVSALIIVVIFVIAVVAVGVGVDVATRGSGRSSSSGNSISPSTSGNSTSTSTTDLAQATNVEFNVTDTASNGTVVSQSGYFAKNIGTSNLEMLVETTSPSNGTIDYIIDGVQKKVWLISSDEEWIDLSDEYTAFFSTYNSTLTGYINTLVPVWTGSGYTYNETNGEGTIKIFNVLVNPYIPDSFFELSDD